MRHEYHEVTDIKETELEDGRILVAERHRRRSVNLPVMGGRFGKHTGPQAMAAIWLLGGTAALVITIVIVTGTTRAINNEVARQQEMYAELAGGPVRIDDDGAITFRHRGKLKTIRPGDKHYAQAREATEKRLKTQERTAEGSEGRDTPPKQPEPAAKKPEGGTPPRVELPVPENPIHQAP